MSRSSTTFLYAHSVILIISQYDSDNLSV